VAQVRFDDSNIRWQRFGDVEHLWLSVLDSDAKNRIVQVLFKFAANQQIVLHRHKTTNKTFVIQGEHRLYHPDGRLKEIRPTGRYTVSPPNDDPHREGGGDQDVVVMFTIYGENDALYELLDDQMNVIASISIDDFAKLTA
jgi:quercetin dioxygenase-like cupin family protein